MSQSYDVWAEVARGGKWEPPAMAGAYKPVLLIEDWDDWYLLNAFGPFKRGRYETWIRPMAPMRASHADVSDKVFGNLDLGRARGTWTWVLLRELLDYDLDYFRIESGYVSEQLWHHFSDPPDLFPEDAFGEVAPEPLAEPGETAEGFYGSHVRWKESPRQRIGYFWDEHVPTLQALGTPDLVRAFVYLW